MRTRTLALLIVALLTGPASAAVEPLPATVEMNRDIRPILADNCFACHGPDSGKRKAGLRLDIEAGTRAKRRGRQAIVPGKPEQSEAYLRIISNEETEQMPPPKAHRQLTARQKELVRLWIAQGARWQKHWSLIPPVRPTPPHVKSPSWCRSPLDAFIL